MIPTRYGTAVEISVSVNTSPLIWLTDMSQCQYYFAIPGFSQYHSASYFPVS